ncbi:MAG: hypothetical protein WKF89_09590 [Chitinophagaceae bacterium]
MSTTIYYPENFQLYILVRLDNAMMDDLNSHSLLNKGLPTLHSIFEALNLSPRYLNGLLKALTIKVRNDRYMKY